MIIKEKHMETVLEALAERICELKTDVYLKDAEIDRLRAGNAELKKLREASYGKEN
jgi:hypothetical protein